MRAKRLVRRLALISLLASLRAPTALAGGYSVGVNGALSAPMSSFKDPFKIGYNAGATADCGITSAFGAGIDVGFHSWKGRSAFWDAFAIDHGAAAGTTMSAKLTAIQYGVHGTLTLPVLGPIHPFGRFGVDGYNLKQTTRSNDPDF